MGAKISKRWFRWFGNMQQIYAIMRQGIQFKLNVCKRRSRESRINWVEIMNRDSWWIYRIEHKRKHLINLSKWDP